MAGSATAGAEITRVIIGTSEIERRIEQSGFLESDEDGVGSVCGAKSAITEPGSGAAGFFEAFGDGSIRNEASTSFEDTQDVSWLSNFEARKRIEVRKDSFASRFFGCGRGDGLDALWCAMHAVAFTVNGPFFRDSTVVVEGSSPEHAAVCHHAFFYFERFGAVTPGGTATYMSNAKVAGVNEANELGVFVIQDGVGADRVCRGAEDIGEARMNMRVVFSDCVRIATVAIDAAEFDRIAEVRIVGVGVAADAARAFGERLVLGLAGEVEVLEVRRNGKWVLLRRHRGRGFFRGGYRVE